MEAEGQKAAIRAWIEDIEAQFRIGRPELADRAKVARGTIYRWFDDEHPFNPSLTTLRKIARAFDVPLPSERPNGSEPGFRDGDVQQLFKQDVPDGLKAGDNQGTWRVATRALELAGYLPGDVVLVDLAVEPAAGDVVCAQVYNLDRGTAETRLRIYEPPYLVTRTMDPASQDRPLFVDRERVIIMGTVVRSLRVRPT